MTELNRDALKEKFKDGERPSGQDFADVMDSCVNKQSDGLKVEAGTLSLANTTPGSPPGGLRYQGNQVQVQRDGANWENLAMGVGFKLIDGTDALTYGGKIGIGDFTTAPTYRLQVKLNNTDSSVCFGSVVCGNFQGDAGKSNAFIAHQDHATTDACALCQESDGTVDINSPQRKKVLIRQDGIIKLAISEAGGVIVGIDQEIDGRQELLQVSGSLYVDRDLSVKGKALKSNGGTWENLSDMRLKEDVQDLETGLAELQRVRPVRFRYNGRAGTPAGLAGVGVIAQEIEQVFPDMVRRVPGGLDGDPEAEDLRVFDGSALTFVLVNAVKELALKVEQLEQALAAVRREPGADGTKA